MDTYNRSIRGLKSRSNGEYFERMIIAASRFYEDRGIAVIDKTPEAFKVIKPYNTETEASSYVVLHNRLNRILKAP